MRRRNCESNKSASVCIENIKFNVNIIRDNSTPAPPPPSTTSCCFIEKMLKNKTLLLGMREAATLCELVRG